MKFIQKLLLGSMLLGTLPSMAVEPSSSPEQKSWWSSVSSAVSNTMSAIGSFIKNNPITSLIGFVGSATGLYLLKQRLFSKKKPNQAQPKKDAPQSQLSLAEIESQVANAEKKLFISFFKRNQDETLKIAEALKNKITYPVVSGVSRSFLSSYFEWINNSQKRAPKVNVDDLANVMKLANTNLLFDQPTTKEIETKLQEMGPTDVSGIKAKTDFIEFLEMPVGVPRLYTTQNKEEDIKHLRTYVADKSNIAEFSLSVSTEDKKNYIDVLKLRLLQKLCTWFSFHESISLSVLEDIRKNQAMLEKNSLADIEKYFFKDLRQKYTGKPDEPGHSLGGAPVSTRDAVRDARLKKLTS